MATAGELQREMIAAVEARDWTRLRKVFHPEYRYTTSEGEVGIDGAVDLPKRFTTAFPDATIEIRNRYAPSDDVSITEAICRGTHTAPLEGIAGLPSIAPTGKKVEFMLCVFSEARDGKLYRDREYWDNLALVRQLGLTS